MDDIFGNKLYQKRARLILPILVNQAKIRELITYKELAGKINAYHRNMNYPLGSISKTLFDLNKSRTNKVIIPPIQCIVVSKTTGKPGAGVWWYIEQDQFERLDEQQQNRYIREQQIKVFDFERWDNVLKELKLL